MYIYYFFALWPAKHCNRDQRIVDTMMKLTRFLAARLPGYLAEMNNNCDPV